MSQLNADQQAAADEFYKFLIDPTQKEISISGPAGTGKTYLLQHLDQTVMPSYRELCKIMGYGEVINKVEFTALTNRAADVLSETMKKRAQTIHSFMNLKVYDDYDSGKQKIQKTRNFNVHYQTLIFIDEASMIDETLYRIIQEGTHSSCKIVYVGDHNQLSPVGERLSVVFSQPHIKRLELKTPVRNAAQPALMALCQQFRETVETGKFKPITLVPGVIELLSDQEMQAHVNGNFVDENYDSRILAYTNNQVKDYNDYIRSIRGYGDRLHNKEIVINNTGMELPGNQGMLSAEMEFMVRIPDNAPDQTIIVDGSEIHAYTVQLISLKGGVIYTVLQPLDKDFATKLTKYFGRQKMWPQYFQMKNLFPDLRSRSASTVYKAQGSTFDSVYIDLQNIGTSNVPNQVARMLYVAASRPRNKIYFYGRLPDKYLGG